MEAVRGRRSGRTANRLRRTAATQLPSYRSKPWLHTFRRGKPVDRNRRIARRDRPQPRAVAGRETRRDHDERRSRGGQPGVAVRQLPLLFDADLDRHRHRPDGRDRGPLWLSRVSRLFRGRVAIRIHPHYPHDRTNTRRPVPRPVRRRVATPRPVPAILRSPPGPPASPTRCALRPRVPPRRRDRRPRPRGGTSRPPSPRTSRRRALRR